ncbi:hypothetical protein [Acinetobacter sp. Ac_5812]|uniref:hypothetical protein n=1 Tax=Acinetobacter sp. Ac_5812 TaxID=1848937 RepID=UPI00148FF782|nr:hypothetical protein [Acinetobacter sp. Ac_5812]NNP68945.1 hypothetical protein [Acinetobacter sp. Ac_5812]
MQKKSVVCIGGFMDGIEVPFNNLEFAPMSETDHRDYFELPVSEMVVAEKPVAFYHPISFDCNGYKLNFYLWDNDQSLLDSFIQPYLKKLFDVK